MTEDDLDYAFEGLAEILRSYGVDTETAEYKEMIANNKELVRFLIKLGAIK